MNTLPTNQEKAQLIRAAIAGGKEVFVRLPERAVDFGVTGARLKSGRVQVAFEGCYFWLADSVPYATSNHGRSPALPLW